MLISFVAFFPLEKSSELCQTLMSNHLRSATYLGVSDCSHVEQKRFNDFASSCRNVGAIAAGSVVYPTAGFSFYAYTSTISRVSSKAVTGKETLILQGCFQYMTLGQARFSLWCYFYNKGNTVLPNLNVCLSESDAS